MLFISPATAQTFTDFYNDGAQIGVTPNTIVYVGGHVTNTGNAALIHNEGDIYLTGNWKNNTLNGLDPNTGTVILYGTANQSIEGSAETTFNNLDCQFGTTKQLNVNTTVGGTSGVLMLNSSPFDLNSFTCKVTNSLSSAITRTSGYIISETSSSPGYGRVEWDIDNTVNNYTIPFGSSTGDYIPFLYNVTTAGSAGGNISVATYPTDVTATPNNRPLPSGVNDLNDANGNENAAQTVDRFWVMDMNYSSPPTADLTFTYRDSEWNTGGGSSNSITQDSLQAWQWDGSQWANPTVGSYIGSYQVKATGINYSGPWTLAMRSTNIPTEGCGDYSVPNAFSPNGDGHNDKFVLHGWANCVTDFTINIFDRWGEKVFETENPANSWDGTYKGKALDAGVFVYYIKGNSANGNKLNKKGNISLIR